MSRLRLGLELDSASRGGQVRDIVQVLAHVAGVKGALIVAPDGFVIAADTAQDVAPESLAALAATLGRDLEVGASRLGRGAFQTAQFAADEGTLFLATSPIGFVVVLAAPTAGLPSVRDALADAVGVIEAAWCDSAGGPTSS